VEATTATKDDGMLLLVVSVAGDGTWGGGTGCGITGGTTGGTLGVGGMPSWLRLMPSYQKKVQMNVC